MSLPPIPSIASLRHLSVTETKKRLLDGCPEEWQDDFSFLLESAEIHTNDFWLNSCIFELKRIRQQHDLKVTLDDRADEWQQLLGKTSDLHSALCEQGMAPIISRSEGPDAKCGEFWIWGEHETWGSRPFREALGEEVKKRPQSLIIQILMTLLRLCKDIPKIYDNFKELGDHLDSYYTPTFICVCPETLRVYFWHGDDPPIRWGSHRAGSKGQWRQSDLSGRYVLINCSLFDVQNTQAWKNRLPAPPATSPTDTPKG